MSSPSIVASDITATYQPIPRLSCPVPEDFERLIATRREPVIVTDLISQWPAFGKWTPEFFQQHYGDIANRMIVDMPTSGVSYDLPADQHGREMRLAEFIDFMREADKPCYFRRQHADKLPGVGADCEFARLTPSEKNPTEFVWIGSAGTRTGLHFDMQDNVLCQFYGGKDIWLVPPEDSRYVYAYPDSITKSKVAVDQPDIAHFPLFAKARVMHGSLAAGELLFIPHSWWHSVISNSVSISFSHEFGSKIGWSQIAQAINAGGLGHWLTVIRDFVRHGICNRPFSRRLHDDPPFGRLVYEMLQGALARRV